MNSPEKDMISYDRIRNREKLGSAKYWILGVLILVLQLIGYPGTVPFAIPDMSGAVTSTLRFWNV